MGSIPVGDSNFSLLRARVMLIYKFTFNSGGGGRGGGRGRSKREGSGREMRNANYLIQQCVTKLLKSRNQNIFDLHLTSSQSLLRLLSKRANENLRLG